MLKRNNPVINSQSHTKILQTPVTCNCRLSSSSAAGSSERIDQVVHILHDFDISSQDIVDLLKASNRFVQMQLLLNKAQMLFVLREGRESAKVIILFLEADNI